MNTLTLIYRRSSKEKNDFTLQTTQRLLQGTLPTDPQLNLNSTTTKPLLTQTRSVISKSAIPVSKTTNSGHPLTFKNSPCDSANPKFRMQNLGFRNLVGHRVNHKLLVKSQARAVRNLHRNQSYHGDVKRKDIVYKNLKLQNK